MVFPLEAFWAHSQACLPMFSYDRQLHCSEEKLLSEKRLETRMAIGQFVQLISVNMCGYQCKGPCRVISTKDSGACPIYRNGLLSTSIIVTYATSPDCKVKEPERVLESYSTAVRLELHRYPHPPPPFGSKIYSLKNYVFPPIIIR
jgi:hypothetical protein